MSGQRLTKTLKSNAVPPELLREIKQIIRDNIPSAAAPKEEIATLGAHLWDEITKAIAQKMQDQLIPVVNFIYNKAYPMDTKIELLSTEYATRKKRPGHPAPLILADLTFRIDDREIYHLEFQIEWDGNISIRMMEYDFQIALQHDTKTSPQNGVTAMRFPHSAVIYPAGGKNLPEYLDCKLRFPDGTSHIYRIPTVDISKYELKELFEKQLNMFLPFSLLRFTDRLDYLKRLRTELERAVKVYEDPTDAVFAGAEEEDGDMAAQTSAHADKEMAETAPAHADKEMAEMTSAHADLLTIYNRYRKYEDFLKKDLTAFVNELILGLDTEYNQQIITKQYYDDYFRMVYYALERVLHSHPALGKETEKMTESKFKLFHEIVAEKDAEIAEKDAEISKNKAALSEKDAEISKNKAALSEKDAEIAALKRQLAELQKK